MQKITLKILVVMLMLIIWPKYSVQAIEFNRNYIISDQEMFDGSAMSLEQVQSFLRSKQSYLAEFSVADSQGRIMSAAEIIVQAAAKHNVSPQTILVMLQKEQSLIEEAKPNYKQLDWAMGYGVCDNCSMNDPALLIFRGFAQQVDMAAARLRWFFDNPQSFKQAGQPYIIDGHQVIPANAATAALYSYTPHIHGNYLFWKIWQRWFKQYYPDGSLLQAAGEPGVWLIQYGLKRPIVNRSALISRFDPSRIVVVASSELDKYESGSPIKFANYSLLKNPEGRIFLLVDDLLRHIDSMATFRSIGFNMDEVVAVQAGELAGYALGAPITMNDRYPIGALLQNNETGAVFFVQAGVKYPLVAREIMQINYPRYPVIAVEPEELETFATGAIIKFREGELLKSESHAVVYVVSQGLKKPFVSGKVFEQLGFHWQNVKTVSDSALATLPTGEYVDLSFKQNGRE